MIQFPQNPSKKKITVVDQKKKIASKQQPVTMDTKYPPVLHCSPPLITTDYRHRGKQANNVYNKPIRAGKGSWNNAEVILETYETLSMETFITLVIDVAKWAEVAKPQPDSHHVFFVVIIAYTVS
jgi:hypothetical protein